jgi:hypothetical protein
VRRTSTPRPREAGARLAAPGGRDVAGKRDDGGGESSDGGGGDPPPPTPLTPPELDLTLLLNGGGDA